MKCNECEEETGESVRVRYTDGTTETLPLCERCRERFTDGDLVSEVQPIEVE